jgi:Mg-chelatase subunit ChlD
MSLKSTVASGLVLFTTLGLPAIAEEKKPQKTVEVVFVLDTTSSMQHLIEGAKRKIWSIATVIVDQNPHAEIKMGLVAYRDIGDDYVTKSFPLTKDIQALYGELLNLKAIGGGDTPESVNEALDHAITKSEWSQDERTDRIVFLVGDAPPHMDYKQDRKYPEILPLARTRGIIVNAVQAGDSAQTRKIWRDIAKMGNGQYIPIPQDGGKVRTVETPYDGDIVKLQIEINNTVISYGSDRQRSETEQKFRNNKSAPASVASDISSYMNKQTKGRDVITGDGDLVSDLKKGGKTLGQVKDDELPEPLRQLDAKGREAFVDAQQKKRQNLAEQMTQLVKERDEFVAKAEAAVPTEGDSFDKAVKNTLREQLKP